MKNFIIKVRGVSFQGRPAIIEKLTGDEPIRLEPEPDNPFDANAIKVLVAFEGQVYQIGYVPKELAAQIAPLMGGEPLLASIHKSVGGYYTHTGVQVAVEVPEEGEEGKMLGE